MKLTLDTRKSREPSELLRRSLTKKISSNKFALSSRRVARSSMKPTASSEA
jgi:hypothetical protein